MFRDHNPLLLTADGEFVAKNLVLVSAAIVLITHATGFRSSPGRERDGPGCRAYGPVREATRVGQPLM